MHAMKAKSRGWADQQEDHFSGTDEGPETPEYAAYSGFHKPQQQQQQPLTPTSQSSNSSSSVLAVASSLLQRVPGAKTISLFNATLLGLFGLAAALAAWGGGCAMLLVLLARWYLPAHETHVTLPLHFDYAAGPSAAGAWLPLLRPTPITASLSPPPHQTSAAAAGLSFQGNLGPGSSFSVSNSVGNSVSNGGGQGGFLGLGFGPGSRAAGKQGATRRGSWFRSSKQQRKGGRSSGGAESGGGGVLRGGVDVGSGVLVPEGDWLVSLWGRMGLAVELEMPAWPEPDLVQVTSELVSEQGIVLARSSRTWLPKPRPLLFRLAGAILLGPWRALGLVDDTIRVQLPMFEGYQNPQPPPGGWGSVPGLVNLLNPGGGGSTGPTQTQQNKQQECVSGPSSSSASGAGVGGSGGGREGGEGVGEVTGPRAMWLRVTMIGRSAGYGPPKVYRAAARLDMKMSLFDRLAAALRPSLLTCLLLLVGGLGFAVGGSSVACVLLLLAYVLYKWGSSIAAAGDSRDSAANASTGRLGPLGVGVGVGGVGKGGGVYGQDGPEEEEAGFIMDEGSAPAGFGAGFDEGFEDEGGSSLAGRRVKDEQEPYRAASPASMDDSFEAFEDPSEHHTYSEVDEAQQGLLQQQQQQQEQRGQNSAELQPLGHNHTKRQQQQQQQENGNNSSGGAVSSIWRMLGLQQQAKPAAGTAGDGAAAAAAAGSSSGAAGAVSGASSCTAAAAAAGGGGGLGGRGGPECEEQEEELMHDAGVAGLSDDADDEWKDELLAESEEEWQQQQQQQHYYEPGEAAAAAAAAGKGAGSSSRAAAAGEDGNGAARRSGFRYKP